MSYRKSENMYYGYIYKITNSVNKKIYIGQTIRTVAIRFRQHINDSKNNRDNSILHLAFKKYGVDKFDIKTLNEYCCDDKNQLIKILNDEEIKYIKMFNSLDPYGYNLQKGGKSSTNSLKCPVDKYDTNGIYICSYNSISEAVEKSNNELSCVHISECCKGKLYTTGGFVWRYCGDPIDKYDYKKDKRKRCVDVYNKDGSFIKSYETIKDAIIELFNSHNYKQFSHISACCKGTRKNAYGYIWKYSS